MREVPPVANGLADLAGLEFHTQLGAFQGLPGDSNEALVTRQDREIVYGCVEYAWISHSGPKFGPLMSICHRISFNACISACALVSKWSLALDLWHQMVQKALKPGEITRSAAPRARNSLK